MTLRRPDWRSAKVHRVDAGTILVSTVAGGLAGLATSWINQRWSVGTSRRIRRDQEREEALRTLVERCADVERCVDDTLVKSDLNPNDVRNSLVGYVRQLTDVWRVSAGKFVPETEVLLTDVVESCKVASQSLGVVDVQAVSESARRLRMAVERDLS
jgi:hypothetical protein